MKKNNKKKENLCPNCANQLNEMKTDLEAALDNAIRAELARKMMKIQHDINEVESRIAIELDAKIDKIRFELTNLRREQKAAIAYMEEAIKAELVNMSLELKRNILEQSKNVDRWFSILERYFKS